VIAFFDAESAVAADFAERLRPALDAQDSF
jgi:hypothetical protein